MKKNKTTIQDEELSKEKYKEYEKILFSDSSSVKDLESVCMTLAHIPSKNAQDILGKFRKSKRAHEVGWLECAIEEGKWWYMDPQNELEEREYLSLKIMQEIEDELIESEIELNDIRLEMRKQEIEHKAIRDLVKNNKIDKDEALGLEDIECFNKSRLEKLTDKINLNEKIFNQIKGSIKTDRYKDMDLSEMRSIHFTQ